MTVTVQLAFTLERQGAVELWDALTFKRIGAVAGGNLTAPITSDGHTLAGISVDKVCIWEWPSGKSRHVLDRRCGRLKAVLFTPDGRSVIAAGESGRILTLNSETGEMIAAPAGRDASVNSVVIFSDGKSVATSGRGRPVRFLDAGTGKQLHCFDLPGTKEPLILEDSGRSVLVVNGQVMGAAQNMHRTTRLHGTDGAALSPDWETTVNEDQQPLVTIDKPRASLSEAGSPARRSRRFLLPRAPPSHWRSRPTASCSPAPVRTAP